MLTETALINSGYSVEQPTEFAKRFYKLFNGAMGIAKDAPIEEIDINMDEEDEEEAAAAAKKEEEEEGK